MITTAVAVVGAIATTGAIAQNMVDYECYVYVSSSETGTSEKHIHELPCYPDEVSDSVSVNWSDVSVLGRTPILAYNSTGLRNISFSMDLHLDMYTGYKQVYSITDLSYRVRSLLKHLRAAAYPVYSSAGLKPPLVIFKFGELMMKGVIRSVSFNWKKPIIDKCYSLCSVSIQMDEIVNPNHCEGNSLKTVYNPNALTKDDVTELIEFS